MAKVKIPAKAIENLWNRIEKGMQQWLELINNSFLTLEQKEILKELIETRAKQINLNFVANRKNDWNLY
jgi:serine/threonine-protein kinase HipA